MELRDRTKRGWALLSTCLNVTIWFAWTHLGPSPQVDSWSFITRVNYEYEYVYSTSAHPMYEPLCSCMNHLDRWQHVEERLMSGAQRHRINHKQQTTSYRQFCSSATYRSGSYIGWALVPHCARSLICGTLQGQWPSFQNIFWKCPVISSSDDCTIVLLASPRQCTVKS